MATQAEMVRMVLQYILSCDFLLWACSNGVRQESLREEDEDMTCEDKFDQSSVSSRKMIEPMNPVIILDSCYVDMREINHRLDFLNLNLTYLFILLFLLSILNS